MDEGSWGRPLQQGKQNLSRDLGRGRKGEGSHLAFRKEEQSSPSSRCRDRGKCLVRGRKGERPHGWGSGVTARVGQSWFLQVAEEPVRKAL